MRSHRDQLQYRRLPEAAAPRHASTAWVPEAIYER
ncbi:hypothetical protein FHU29_004578 [Hoyosella altamirensis]|uniref:Uncharacterized protein n=1 Tax=Hoyosella altamirensis TaxID=616997 RepID=A0A839RW68_9ACTN|nr:hypothetical protein [Hoyosella altamirensis]